MTHRGHVCGKQQTSSLAPSNLVVEKIFMYIRDETGTQAPACRLQAFHRIKNFCIERNHKNVLNLNKGSLPLIKL